MKEFRNALQSDYRDNAVDLLSIESITGNRYKPADTSHKICPEFGTVRSKRRCSRALGPKVSDYVDASL